jgi:murein DD-endopeptidase MepM/ murein hydrolase activator NlpD
MIRITLRLATVLTCVLASALAAQTPAVVSSSPATPYQGSVFTILVTPAGSGSGVTAVRGRLAGELLHFRRSAGGFRAVAGVPVNVEGRVEFPLVLRYDDGTTVNFTAAIDVREGQYGADTLRVSSTFSDPLTDEQRARITRERELSRALTDVAHDTPRLWNKPFVRPTRTRITSGYGRARVFNGAIRSRHMGVDLDGDTGDPVRVSNDGVVALVGDFFYSGNTIYVNHGAGLLTAYNHLSRTAVAEGDSVSRGQVIGYVGQTGRVTGPHLHWTARYGTMALNALTLLDLEVPDGRDGTASH